MILPNIDNATNFWRLVLPASNLNSKLYYKTTDLSCANMMIQICFHISGSSPIKHTTLFEIENFRNEVLHFLHPCQSQDVECHIKLLTKESKFVI